MDKVRLTIFVLLLMISEAHALDDFSPARFTDSKYSLQNKIKFPQVDGDISILVVCDAELSRSGRFRLTVCFSERDNQQIVAFEKAVHRAAKFSRIQSAKINGRGKKVWFQYSVEFIKTGDRKSVNVYANHGHDSHRYGKEYTSAQRYKEGSRSYFLGCIWKTNVWVKAIIDEKGIPTSSEIIGGNGTKQCKKSLKKSILKGEYIPATFNSKPVPSVYVESFFSIGAAKNR